MDWIDNQAVLHCLPPPFQRYAGKVRLACRIPGRRLIDPYLFGYLNRIKSEVIDEMRRTRQPDTALVKFPDKQMFVDLYDQRVWLVLTEALGTNAETRTLQALLKPGDTFLDIGANHGTYSMVAGAVVGASGKVISFEPQPRLAGLVRQSAEANGFAHLTVKEVALSDTTGTAEFFVPEFSGTAGLHKAFSAQGAHNSFPVTLMPLDDFLAGVELPGNVLIKMDVEGNELKVIRGGERFLRERRPKIFLEVNEASLNAAGTSEREVLAALQDYGYSQFARIEHFPEQIPLANYPYGEKEQRNIIVS